MATAQFILGVIVSLAIFFGAMFRLQIGTIKLIVAGALVGLVLSYRHG